MSRQAMLDEFERQLKDSAALKLKLFQSQGEVFGRMCEGLVEALRKGGRVYFCGNGGSFTDCHHIVGELVGRYMYDRPPLPAFVLGAGVAAMTAIANDYGYEQVFSREAEACLRQGDVLVGLSTSGNSKNVCTALEVARRKGSLAIGWAGEKRARIDEVSDIVLHVPSSLTPRIQECHIAVGHILCDMVEKLIYPK